MVSNKTYGYLIISALIIMIVSVVVSIGSFSYFFPKEAIVTGNAPTDTGNISLFVLQALSITTIDGPEINFSGCSPGRVIYSDVNGSNTFGSCPNFIADEILVRNDGGATANITVNASNWGGSHGGSFLNATSDDSWIAFKITNSSSNSSYSGGCVGNFQSSWLNITNSSMYISCDRLISEAVRNSFEFDIAIFVPTTTVPGDNELILTFTAYNVI